MMEIASMIRPRYAVALTNKQRKALVGTCDWGGCDEVTVGLRRDSHSGQWISVCEGHVRMGNTVILGVESVLDELAKLAGLG
jgi:hypothetical protein